MISPAHGPRPVRLPCSCAAAAAPPPTRIEQLARILALEDRARGGGELERYLRDPDRGVRRRAALAAGRHRRSGAVPTLVRR